MIYSCFKAELLILLLINMKKIVFLLMAAFTLTACNRVSSNPQIIQLKKGEKLISADIRGEIIYYLCEPADSNYQPKTKTLHCIFSNTNTTKKYVFVEN